MSAPTIAEVLEQLGRELGTETADDGWNFGAVLSNEGFPPEATGQSAALLARSLMPGLFEWYEVEPRDVDVDEGEQGLRMVHRAISLGVMAGLLGASRWARARREGAAG